MAETKIIRVAQGHNTTLSHLYINRVFGCYLLEDCIREFKIPGATCIPTGPYKLKLNKDAGMNERYFKAYPRIHKGMIEISGLANFSLVFIERISVPTPKFFRTLRTIGLVLGAVGGALLAAPVTLSATLVAVAGYVTLAGGVITAISQTAVDDEAKQKLLEGK